MRAKIVRPTSSKQMLKDRGHHSSRSCQCCVTSRWLLFSRWLLSIRLQASSRTPTAEEERIAQ